MSIMESDKPKMTRFQLWKDWSKRCLNHPVYKLLVLIGLANSPSFQIHSAAMEIIERHPNYTYSVQDEKPEKTKKKSDINWGWYTVYLLMIMVNAVMCRVHGFTLITWQYWVYAAMLILCFVSGASYRKKE